MHFLRVRSAFPQMHRENASTDKKPSLKWKRSTPSLTCARRRDLKINLKCLFLMLTLRVHWWSCAQCAGVLTWILIPGLNPGSASLLSAGSYHSAPLLAPCVFSALEQIKCCMLRCQQILQTLMCRWTHKHARKHTHTHTGAHERRALWNPDIQTCKCTRIPCGGFTLLCRTETDSHTALPRAAYHTQITA